MNEIDNKWKDKVILIAEDEKINFLFLKAIFKGTGAKILWAKNGEETVELCRTNKDVDIILMDIKMPGINGLDATRQIKSECPDIAIVAQTAYSLNDDREKAFDAGCDDFLAKPIRPRNLMATVERYLS
jgi:CheY-like chemotaxis protein